MLAIAGAKGGCGKTVTTLGLAEAFARANTPTLAVDTDRQLPNLHVIANVDRHPTLAALESGSEPTDLPSITHPVSRTPDVGIVTAPGPNERIDVEATLGRLDGESIRILLDCPSGVGPDVVESLSAADAMVVVTTETDRSLSAADRTIDVARRLDLPVLGVIVTRTERDSDELHTESSISVPVLGVIPESEDPLGSDRTRAAFDDIVVTLEALLGTTAGVHQFDGDRLETGVPSIDYVLGGGLPAGSIAAVTANPASQSEQLLYEMTRSRGTLYLTCDRSVASVSRALETTPVPIGNPTIRQLDRTEPFDHARHLIGKLPDRANVIIDSVNELERAKRTPYRDFLEFLANRMHETSGITLLHCLTGSDIPRNRAETIHQVDTVLDIDTVSPGPETGVEHYLSVPKCRAGAVAERISLDFETVQSTPPESIVGETVNHAD